MNTTINKSAKRVLSLCLAFALLLGSLFIANVGVSVNTAAATDSVKTVTDTWDGSGSTAPSKGSGTESDPYIIETAEQLYYIANPSSSDIANATAGKYYKVADDIKAFYLNGETITEDTDYETAMSTLESMASGSTVKQWCHRWNAFQGYFDGNGVIIAGMYTAKNQRGGLFSFIAGSATIKNVTVVNSYVKVEYAAGAIAGMLSGTPGEITISNCVVKDCHLECTADGGGSGAILGKAQYGAGAIYVKNCFADIAVEDLISLETTMQGGLVGFINVYSTGTILVSDSVTLGIRPYITWNDSTVTSGNYQYSALNQANYSNLYTDHALDTAKNTAYDHSAYTTVISADSIVGAFAKLTLSDFNFATDTTDGDWYVMDGDYPTPIKPYGFKDMEAPAVWEGGCADAFESGSGTEADPFIIKTPDQLYKMVNDGGMYNGTPAYYEVADGVDVLYLSQNVNKTAEQMGVAGAALYNAAISEGNWVFDDLKAFVGNFDGKGVVIMGMICSKYDTSLGLIPWLGTGAVVKNITFDGCFVKTSHESGVYDGPGQKVSMLSSKTTNYQDDDQDGTIDGGRKDGYTLVESVAVVNSYYSAYNISGLVHSGNDYTPDYIHFVNCLYDGASNVASSTGGSVAGIYGHYTYGNNFELRGCVSINAALASDHAQGVYNDYTNNTTISHAVYFTNSYALSTTDASYKLSNNSVGTTDISITGVTDDCDYMTELPLLDWQNGWQVVTENGRNIPMPRVNDSDIDVLATEESGRGVLDYGELLGTQYTVGDWGMGAMHTEIGVEGEYGHFSKFEGEGTAESPFLIKTPLDLARAIGSGGQYLGQKFYFKLANDIDLGGYQWLNAVTYTKVGSSTYQYYVYAPFEGVLDGDGHTITGLYAVGINGTEKNPQDIYKYAGLIPVLDGGTVKNLHISDSYVGSITYGGAIAGYCENSNSEITGCSVIDTIVYTASSYDKSNILFPFHYLDINSVENNTCEINGTTYYTTSSGACDYAGCGDKIDFTDTTVWYVGGGKNCTPQLLSRAQAMPCADIDGDGKGDEYTSNDLTALRQKLLNKTAYANIYGDVSGDGVINVGDLAILKRVMADKDNWVEAGDSFWNNVKYGNVAIYYGENDNYDAARKIELYLESVAGVDVVKYASYTATSGNIHPGEATGTPDGTLDVIVGYISGTSYASDSEIGTNQYRIKFDEANKVLWFEGENFTAVEQAVINFVNSASTTTEPATTDVATLDAEKQPVTVNGTTYYYIWGDEFETLNYANWQLRPAASEGSTGEDGQYWNLQTITPSAANKLVTVSGGVLYMKRGFINGTESKTAAVNDWVMLEKSEIDASNGVYAVDTSSDVYFNSGTLQTVDTMMFKQGYVEIQASIPADGHAFPALWLYGAGSSYNFRNSGWDASLFSKIYELNTGWDGSTDTIDWSTTSTQKYNYPTNFYELDIVELMQSAGELEESGFSGWWSNLWSSTDYTKAVYLYDVKTTIHKWDREGGHTEISNNSSTWYSFYNQSIGTSSNVSYNSGAQTRTETMRKWGFEWYTTSSGTVLKTIIYNADGSGTDVTITASPTTGDIINEYMYVLLDNKYYTSYDGTQFNNNLSTSGDQTALEVDYVRVYQQDGKRDVVTVETENFNGNIDANGNPSHFGY